MHAWTVTLKEVRWTTEKQSAGKTKEFLLNSSAAVVFAIIFALIPRSAHHVITMWKLVDTWQKFRYWLRKPLRDWKCSLKLIWFGPWFGLFSGMKTETKPYKLDVLRGRLLGSQNNFHWQFRWPDQPPTLQPQAARVIDARSWAALFWAFSSHQHS